MSQRIVDFQSSLRTMPVADPEDRALLGSNPSAAVGDGDNNRSVGVKDAPAPNNLFPVVFVHKAVNPCACHSLDLKEISFLTLTGVPFGNISGAAGTLSSPMTINMSSLRDWDCLEAKRKDEKRKTFLGDGASDGI